MKADQYDLGYALGAQALAQAKQEIQKEAEGLWNPHNQSYVKGLQFALDAIEKAQEGARSKF